MPPLRGFSFFGGTDSKKNEGGLNREVVALPSLKLQTDKDVYRPGDPVLVTIEIRNPPGVTDEEGKSLCSLLIERLSFEIKGIEKLDSQWFITQKPLPDSKQRRGEYVFMDCSTTSIVSNQIVSSGATKTYVVRTFLPSIIPPSYRGAAIRYLYYVRSTLSGQYLILDKGHTHRESIRDLAELEARIPLQIWVTQKTNGLLIEEGRTDVIVPALAIFLDVYWKEMDGDSDWARANETYDGVEEGYESSRDEISSVSSYNLTKENIHKAFGSSLSLQSSAARSSIKDATYLEERTSISSYMPPRLSVAEVLYDSGGDGLSPQKSSAIVSPSQPLKHTKSLFTDDDSRLPSVPGTVEPVASEGFIRGRSYNIRLDDQVLLRFSPKTSDSTYYFSDMIGGTLTFFHEEEARRCLELSITLEMSETISRRFVHPSRRHSPTITKVQSDHHEVVADLVQTSFLFSIPMDGPMSFSTPHVSVQWALRFEFFTTPKNVDWTRFEHPLLIEGRDKSEWVLPITVHAPPPGTSVAHARSEKPFSLEPLWVRN
uniref:Reduced growth phenotype protein 1 n=1 Tax=Davidia involucrata TaxID=16924 RepID=A0A5B6YMQ9_DAVIN